jgi:adenine C2-methylase RlmN of 23S rRNA A2503 and tRNA A37
MIIKQSEEDESVNFITHTDPDDKQAFECRYVRRNLEYFIAYLSAQTGCDKGCKMCHLTAMGLTHARDAEVNEILEQADTVLDYYKMQEDARFVHYNFMARGEPLSSQTILKHNDELFANLNFRAQKFGLFPKIQISTIMPKEMKFLELHEVFQLYQPEIYYSLYSTCNLFRKHWLPAALPVDDALDKLKTWQDITNKIVTIHYALIKNENDSVIDVRHICDAIEHHELRANFNFVRYNPYDGMGEEPDEGIIQDHVGELRDRFPESRIQIVDRVGFDVAASCGMFINE